VVAEVPPEAVQEEVPPEVAEVVQEEVLPLQVYKP
jgi:hypothetical protein